MVSDCHRVATSSRTFLFFCSGSRVLGFWVEFAKVVDGKDVEDQKDPDATPDRDLSHSKSQRPISAALFTIRHSCSDLKSQRFFL